MIFKHHSYRVKEIQDVLDKELEYTRVEEYKEQIPTFDLSTILKTYFSSIEKINNTVIDSMIQEQTSIDYFEGAREDDYKVTKIHLADIMSSNQILEIWRVVISWLIAARWYKDNFTNDNDILQQPPITLCVNSDQYQSIIEHLTYKFDYIKQIRSAEVYSLPLQEVNSTRQKYGRGQGIIRKALDIAIATNSFDELMGICHGFILDKQEIQESTEKMDDDIECNIKNPIIIK
ncbi:hypothetical protein C2G38_2167220 [Gigaspora rosea]|uniref:Uncharacterized protein n=1 Tax=Gigaspora rosea TaxID=44941 RepID=A0A397VT36_9GLOM|nr:hypothetical protein C2G38_2167220 [Gigaspora rosea]